MNDAMPSLVIVPEPLENESPASWIKRICELHQCSYLTLFKFLAMKRIVDPDLKLFGNRLARLAYGTQVKRERIMEMGHAFSIFRQYKRWRKLLHKDDNYQPKYKFCSLCLSNDPTPYWRVAWRLSSWDVCPEHLVRMQDGCPHCGSFLRPYSPPLHYDPQIGNLPVCIKCTSCYRSLISEPQESLLLTDELREKISRQKSILTDASCSHRPKTDPVGQNSIGTNNCAQK